MTGWQRTTKSLFKIVHSSLRCAIPFIPILPPNPFYPGISAKNVLFLVRLEGNPNLIYSGQFALRRIGENDRQKADYILVVEN